MQRSDGGGVFDALDRMNGPTLCGCSTIAACQVCCSFMIKKNYLYQIHPKLKMISPVCPNDDGALDFLSVPELLDVLHL